MEIFTSPADRRAAAREALAMLGAHRTDRLRLGVQCSRGHHVAQVYDAEGGLLYVAGTGSRSHGRGDRVDTGHGADRRGGVFVDLVDPGAGSIEDDDLPAGCECGPRTLSRARLMAAVAAEERLLRLV
ncbi:hypothetical protein [Pseudonocardia xishanensis]|uniref:Uncharacterized protein n=1 Tax=Pseudonocardia xishanensis TaxID=630995 RepID=A0ABP8RYU6_9PSEU